MRNIFALARIIFLGGLRSHFILGLLLFSLACEVGSFFYMDFFPRDVGRVSADFILSIAFVAGMLFLFFHAVQVTSLDEEHKSVYLFLSRPLARGHYVLGVYVGCFLLLLLLNSILFMAGGILLYLIKSSVDPAYFPHISYSYYSMSFIGIVIVEMILLAVIMLISSVIRGGFLVLLLSLSYYLTANGLPVVRESLAASNIDMPQAEQAAKILSVIFPDFNRFDYKTLITVPSSSFDFAILGWNSLFAMSYIALALVWSCFIYSRRDLL